ncbi:MAG: winged helix-turn-helix transcriptional regulator [Solirubrobacteraceae bacterium]|nr:winged helix-turn-helix transcriptional regulator [Solirubrobacteraceae bacterium]
MVLSMTVGSKTRWVGVDPRGSQERLIGQRDESVIDLAHLELRPTEGFALVDGRPLKLSVREFGLLAELARNEGRVVSRQALYGHVWGGDLRAGDRTIDVYVRRLRVKLAEQLPDWAFIHTHIGFGYRLQPEPVGESFR